MSNRRPTISRSITDGGAVPSISFETDNDNNNNNNHRANDEHDGRLSDDENRHGGNTRIRNLFYGRSSSQTLNTASIGAGLTGFGPEATTSPNLRTPRVGYHLHNMESSSDVRKHHRRQPSNRSYLSSYFHGYGGTDNGDDTPRTPMVSSGAQQPYQAEERRFYDDFTTIDWTRDIIKESARKKHLESIPGIRGRFIRLWDNAEGWVLITISGFAFALLAYLIDFFEGFMTDLRLGYCKRGWYIRESKCCPESEKFGSCPDWTTWSRAFENPAKDIVTLDFAIFFSITIIFALISVLITLRTKSVNPLSDQGKQESSTSTDPNYTEATATGAAAAAAQDSSNAASESTDPLLEKKETNKRVLYTAYGSGVPEVKTILSGFVIRRFLGTRTLIHKTIALVFSVSSGMSLGKEGPFVHLATSVGNITCRLSRKFSENDMKRRQLLAAAASAGVALAFGSPLGGVLFALEEVSYYFLPQQLFRMFFCAMISTLFLKFMDPYGTGKTVMFEIHYPNDDWNYWELVLFIFLGIAGGIFGAFFCKFHRFYGKTVRQWTPIKQSPTLEVFLVAIITAILKFPGKYTAKSVAELLAELASPCELGNELCPTEIGHYPGIIGQLIYALIVKIILTSIAFGIKVPSGIYIPSMAIGALFGRLTALVVQYIDQMYPMWPLSLGVYVVPGVYAIAAAGAFMAGITRMTVTLAVILFELTGSLEYVLPFSIAILVSNWVANAIEPSSIYDIIMHKNNFPYLDNRKPAVFDSSLADLVTVVHRNEMIDISNSIYVSSQRLRSMLVMLQTRGDFDGCIPLVKRSVLVGVITAPELEFALDQIGDDEYDDILCKMSITEDNLASYYHSNRNTTDGSSPSPNPPNPAGYFTSRFSDSESESIPANSVDLTAFIDVAPITMDIHSPLALVQQVFTKLGTRAICVTRNGQFLGILHRKKYIDFVHNSE